MGELLRWRIVNELPPALAVRVYWCDVCRKPISAVSPGAEDRFASVRPPTNNMFDMLNACRNIRIDIAVNVHHRNDLELVSGRHLAYYAIALVGALFIVFFRLDEVIFKRKSNNRKQKPRRPPTVQSKDGIHMAADPDGTPWKKPRSRK